MKITSIEEHRDNLSALQAWLSTDGKLYQVAPREHIAGAKEIIKTLKLKRTPGLESSDLILESLGWIKIHDGAPIKDNNEKKPSESQEQKKIIDKIAKIVASDYDRYSVLGRRLAAYLSGTIDCGNGAAISVRSNIC